MRNIQLVKTNTIIQKLHLHMHRIVFLPMNDNRDTICAVSFLNNRKLKYNSGIFKL